MLAEWHSWELYGESGTVAWDSSRAKVWNGEEDEESHEALSECNTGWQPHAIQAQVCLCLLVGTAKGELKKPRSLP